jgi:hypothetical protein
MQSERSHQQPALPSVIITAPTSVIEPEHFEKPFFGSATNHSK